jgi:trehalose-phosphatase
LKKELQAPQYLFDDKSYEACLRRVESSDQVAIFLDFDGTLVPIQKDPASCFLSDGTKKLLRSFAASEHCYVGIISGRPLSDLRERVGLRRVYYGGNHGLDICGPNMRFTHPKALSAKPIIAEAKRRLIGRVGKFEGARLEDKIFTVSLHFRAVQEEQIPLLKQAFLKAVGMYLQHGMLTVIQGKKVLELMPSVSWDKGKASLWILQRLKVDCVPLYVGDDDTDESAFSALRQTGITIAVGRSRRTTAEYYLKSQGEVLRALRSLKDHCTGESDPRT